MSRTRRGSAEAATAPRLDRPIFARIDGQAENRRVAELIREARRRVRLTQAQLGKLVGTTQPVIARLENGAYRGHSLRMLQRIASALGCDLTLRFVRRSP